MTEQGKKEGIKLPFMEKFHVGLLFVSVLLTRMFFLDMGFGRPDAWRVGLTGKLWVENGDYFPSRPPGFPLLEMISTLGYSVFGNSPATWIFTNSLTCIVFAISVIGVWALSRKWKLKYPLLIAAIYAFAPLNWVYSIETIDYLWMTSFIIFSALALESDNDKGCLWSGIFLGLAASARFFAVLQLIPFLILAWHRRKSVSDLRMLALPFFVVTLAFYLLIFLQVSDWSEYIDWFHELNRVSSNLAQLKGGTLMTGFLIPAVKLFGPLATLVLIVAGISGVRNFSRLIRERNRGMLAALIIALFIMVPYLWHLHPNYWIPAIPFLLILLGFSVNIRILFVAGMLIFLANFPAWQTGVEGLRVFSPNGRNSGVENYARAVAAFQNETVFTKLAVRQMVHGRALELLNLELPSESIVMTTTQLPVISFLGDGFRQFELTPDDGDSISVWGSPEGGPYYKYLVSPDQVRRLNEYGYRIFYARGIETTYLATYGTNIENVAGVELISSQ